MHYRLSPDPGRPYFIAVEAHLTDVQAAAVALQLPAWRPGRYELQHFAKNIQRFEVFDENQNPLPVRKRTNDCWEVQTQGAAALTARYNYYTLLPVPNQLNAGSSFVSDTLLYVNPVNLCVYADGRIGEPCVLDVALPDEWTLATGLAEVPSEQTGWRRLQADDFYELADGPLLAAPALQHIGYEVRGVAFHVWLHGGWRSDGSPAFEAARLRQDFSRFSETQIRLFGEFPERDYHFLVLVLPVAYYHGVEHRNSTVLVLGPADEGEGLYQDLLGVASHELFHAWNVIRIRPAELLPYDFTRENYFTTCFVAEGVTTYYGDLMLRRAGVFDDEAYLKELQVLCKRHFEQAGRAVQSLTESSWDLWLDGYEKGIPDRKVSVYHKGALVALILDLHVRKQSNHTRTLDDVMRLMWQRFGKPFVGYTLADYRAVAEEVAGEALDWYVEVCIEGNEPLETLLNTYLDWVGLAVVWETGAPDKPATVRLVETENPNGRAERSRWFGHSLTEPPPTDWIPEAKPGKNGAAQ